MKTVVFLMFFLPMQILAGRNYTIELVIKDDFSDLPLADVKIEVEDLGVELTTDAAGNARITACQLKEFSAVISHPNYDSIVIQIERKRGRDIIRTVRLKPNSKQILKHFEELYEEEMKRFAQRIASIDTAFIPPCDSVKHPEDLNWDAEFPGGTANLQRFVNYTINYPLEARELGEQGIVYVSAVIDLDGSVIDVMVMRGVSSSLDREAKRIINEMPKWIPAYCNGRPTRTRFSMPIRFLMD